jgi:CsoR family transcriptional regulator, copper-sensing transcriptional repressor
MSSGHAHASGKEAALCMPAATRADAARRLAVAKGHLEGVLRMLEGGEVYCVDVMRQIKAVSGALDKARDVVLEGHLKAHVATAQSRGDAADLVGELMDVLKYR